VHVAVDTLAGNSASRVSRSRRGSAKSGAASGSGISCSKICSMFSSRALPLPAALRVPSGTAISRRMLWMANTSFASSTPLIDSSSSSNCSGWGDSRSKGSKSDIRNARLRLWKSSSHAGIAPVIAGELSGLADQVLGQQADRSTRGALGGAFIPRGAGNIQVRPAVFSGVARQERGRRDRAAADAADIGHVGKIAVELFLVVIPQRHLPGTIADGLTRRQQLGGEIILATEQPARVFAECHHAGAGECGDIYHRRRLEACGIGERVAQDQTAFG